MKKYKILFCVTEIILFMNIHEPVYLIRQKVRLDLWLLGQEMEIEFRYGSQERVKRKVDKFENL